MDPDAGETSPFESEDAEQLLLSLSPIFNEILERSQRRLEQEGGLTTDDVRKQLGLS
ncbi:MAG TPA: hypothetical protein VET25_12595 [Aestuariivirgaceae bacterium]|nr:hypothetical protein [Aestuariivirgaceae bacterium]